MKTNEVLTSERKLAKVAGVTRDTARKWLLNDPAASEHRRALIDKKPVDEAKWRKYSNAKKKAGRQAQTPGVPKPRKDSPKGSLKDEKTRWEIKLLKLKFAEAEGRMLTLEEWRDLSDSLQTILFAVMAEWRQWVEAEFRTPEAVKKSEDLENKLRRRIRNEIATRKQGLAGSH